MKSFLKYASIITLFLFGFIFNSCVYALEDSTSYVNIHLSSSLRVGDLAFETFDFIDNSSSSTQSIGVSGSVYSFNEESIGYKLTLGLFDSSYNMIGEYTKSYTASPRTRSKFTHMASIDILKGKSFTDVLYYKVSVAIEDINGDEATIFDTPSKVSSYKSLDYVIDAYDIDVIVNKNNTFDITEHITAYFNKAKHGIFRKIPLKNEVNRIDGTSSNNRAVISNLSVDNEYTTSRSSGIYTIKIGDANTTLTGKHEYTIKYTYNIGKDPLKDIDELYFNIIGDEWDTVIGNITFKVTMPDEFDETKLGFSTGYYGSTDNDLINYTVEGNVIKGSYKGILKANNALTIRTELPEGYFVGAGIKFNPLNLLIIIIPVVCAIVSVIIWKRYGKDDLVVDVVEFYPPEGFNSLEVGFFYKGEAEDKDVTSLLIYLANKGYIKIRETEEKSLFSKTKGFRITKLKEYDGTNINERLFLEGLFKDNKTEVGASDLQNSFYRTKNKILNNINDKKNKDIIFESKASSKNPLLILFMIVSYSLITIPPIVLFSDIELIIFALIFPPIGFAVIFAGIGELIKHKAKGLLPFIFTLIWGIPFGFLPWSEAVLPALLIDKYYLIAYIIGVISLVVIKICKKYLPKRTSYGTEMLGKLNGFKSFLTSAEKDRLESLVLENPTYFYDILPYAYVLGVSDKWIKNFESIMVEAPSWYDSPNAFDIVVFNSFVESTMSSASSAMSSSPSSSSGGGGSSGGGFSGGGSGGGGGGSW